MGTRPQQFTTLVIVIVLAVALTFVASGGVLARTAFQSAIETPLDNIVTLTPEPVFTPDTGAFATLTPLLPEASPSPTFSVELTPTLPIVLEATPTVSSFLPPPTLVKPSSVAPGRLTPLAPGNPPLIGPAAPAELTATPVPPQALSAAELIDSGVVALSYLWLCCGALLLVAAGLVVLWLWRRSKRK